LTSARRRNELARKARHMARDGWMTNDLRRIDGGADYYVPPEDSPDMVVPLPDVRPEELSRAEGDLPLWFARSLMAQGYDEEYVSQRTGWGTWWLR
jgi:hypothetical protein